MVLHSINVLQVDGNRVLAGFVHRDIADSVGRQVGMAILVIWDLILPKVPNNIVSTAGREVISGVETKADHLPFVQPHGILDEEESLIRQQRRPERSGQIQGLEKHLGDFTGILSTICDWEETRRELSCDIMSSFRSSLRGGPGVADVRGGDR